MFYTFRTTTSIYLPKLVYTLVVILLWSKVVIGSSQPSRPLKQIEHPVVLALEVVPRRQSSSGILAKRSSLEQDNTPVLRHSDTLRLSFSAFGDLVHLHLRPNEHLLHPSARVNYYRNGPDGEAILDRVEPIMRENFKVYVGEVIHADHTSQRFREDISSVVPSPSRSDALGWARIMVHHQGDMVNGISPVFEGTFFLNGVVHHVLTKDNYLRNKQALDPSISSKVNELDSTLVIFRDSDVMTELELNSLSGHKIDNVEATVDRKHSSTCSHDLLDFNINPQKNNVLRRPVAAAPAWYDPLGVMDILPIWNNSLYKRDDVAGGNMTTNFEDNIGQTSGCPADPRILYMGVAADCQYTKVYGSTQNATRQILNNWNSASNIYQSTFNISLGIINLDINESDCPSPQDESRAWNVDCSNITLNDRLSLFSEWRGTQGDDGAGLWHLMSGCPTGNEVGIAWLGTLCQQNSTGDAPNTVSGTAVSTNGLTEWQVVAHEIGHNFGAIHDCQDGCNTDNSTTPCCPLSTDTCDASGAFIMSPITSSGQKSFSQCSLGNICSLMTSGAQNGVNTTCLQNSNPAIRILTTQMCGNGIVESGEDCDPGPNTTSTCCDSSTCKFTSNAVCDPANSPCCSSECQFAPATQVCRPSVNAICDIPEMCTGNSSACPANLFAKNGLSCGSSGLACANGQCTSETLQCQTFGSSMGLTKSCPQRDSNSCMVSCQSPTNEDSCVQLQPQLVDGSPCGVGGTCMSGVCKAGSILDTVEAWYTQNLQIAIPISVVSGLVVLLFMVLIFFAIRRRCIRRKDSQAGLERLKNTEPPDWTPPVPFAPASAMRPVPPSIPRRPDIPAVLRSGSREGFKRTPTLISSSDSFTSVKKNPWITSTQYANWDSKNGSGYNINNIPQTLPQKDAQFHWIDTTPYNGPRY